ncbi:MAG TPA: VOC family protein [Herpetosiphonaceae bacterium]
MADVVSWFEIPASDFDRAVGFYSTILGKELPLGDFMGTPHGFFCNSDGSQFGAVIKHETAVPGNTGTLLYLYTKNLDQVLERVEGAGGSIEQPKTSIGEMGWIAVVVDTEGNRIGLHTD